MVIYAKGFSVFGFVSYIRRMWDTLELWLSRISRLGTLVCKDPMFHESGVCKWCHYRGGSGRRCYNVCRCGGIFLWETGWG